MWRERVMPGTRVTCRSSLVHLSAWHPPPTSAACTTLPILMRNISPLVWSVSLTYRPWGILTLHLVAHMIIAHMGNAAYAGDSDRPVSYICCTHRCGFCYHLFLSESPGSTHHCTMTGALLWPVSDQTNGALFVDPLIVLKSEKS